MINKDDLLNSEFLKQFKNSKDFSSFMEQLYKRGVEKMLEGELSNFCFPVFFFIFLISLLKIPYFVKKQLTPQLP